MAYFVGDGDGSVLTDGLLNILALVLLDARVCRRLLVSNHVPEQVPRDAEHAVEVEARLPADVLGKDA